MQLLKGKAYLGSSPGLCTTRAPPLILGHRLPGLCSGMPGAVETPRVSMSQLPRAFLSLSNVMSILVNSDFGHFPQFIEIQMNKDFRHIKKQRRA